MPIQKMTFAGTVLIDAESPEAAEAAFQEMCLADIAEAIDTGSEIGSWAIAGIVTVPENEVEDALKELGNDGTFFDYRAEEA